MADIKQARAALVARVTKGEGRATAAQRQAAFENTGLEEPIATLVDKVANRSYQVTDHDIEAAKLSDLSENQIFELLVCAAIGEAGRQYDRALTALTTVTGKG